MADILAAALAGAELRPGVRILPGQGNTAAIETEAGVVVLDASSARHVEGMLTELRGHTDAAVHELCQLLGWQKELEAVLEGAGPATSRL